MPAEGPHALVLKRLGSQLGSQEECPPTRNVGHRRDKCRDMGKIQRPLTGTQWARSKWQSSLK